MAKLRIVILNTFPVWGGDENWTINVGKGLVEKGHDVVVSCPPKSETLKRAEQAGLRTFAFHIGPDVAFWKIPPFYRYLKKNKIEVLLCVQNRDVKIGALAARIAGLPAIFFRQGLDTIKKKFDHKMPFTKFVDGIITNTKSIKDLYETYGWFPEDFIHVVYDGLTLPADVSIIDLHKEFDLIPESKVIIGTGRLARQKRFDLLIDVARKAKEKSLNWSIIVAGKGDLEKTLLDEAEKQGVSDMIKFIGFRSDVLSLMKSADMFVLSSDSEGMSNALREGMGVGTACVATNVFGVEELFQNDESGIMVEKGNADSIFGGIEKVFGSIELKKKIEKNAVEMIRQKFTMQQMIDNIEKLFLDQLKRR